jgi:PadR family transcriptional regulator, regulatory protein PadR
VQPSDTNNLDIIYCLAYSVHDIVSAEQQFENLRLELRRGCLVLAVLAQLRTEQYGYVLRKALADQGMDIDENTLYPLLRRLESQGLLVSQWREQDKRNKRFYRLSPDGELIFTQLLNEWQAINLSLKRVITGSAISQDSEILVNQSI